MQVFSKVSLFVQFEVDYCPTAGEQVACDRHDICAGRAGARPANFTNAMPALRDELIIRPLVCETPMNHRTPGRVIERNQRAPEPRMNRANMLAQGETMRLNARQCPKRGIAQWHNNLRVH